MNSHFASLLGYDVPQYDFSSSTLMKEAVYSSETMVAKFLVNKTNRRTPFQFYWYYDSTFSGQPFCPSSGVLGRTSALV